MIDRDDIAVCVEIAQRGYRALQWLNRMLGEGILPVEGRKFAWNAQGSPKRDFTLRAKAIFAAEDSLAAALR